MDHQALKLLLQNQLIWFPNRWNHLIITQQALQKQARWRVWDILMMDCVSSDVFLAVIAAWCCRINAAADKQGRSDSSEALKLWSSPPCFSGWVGPLGDQPQTLTAQKPHCSCWGCRATAAPNRARRASISIVWLAPTWTAGVFKWSKMTLSETSNSIVSCSLCNFLFKLFLVASDISHKNWWYWIDFFCFAAPRGG